MTALTTPELDDLKNARDRQIRLRDPVPAILAIVYLIGYMGIQFFCVRDHDPINDIISARFQDVLIMVFGYYFGSMNKTP